jgi:hypothetical protein
MLVPLEALVGHALEADAADPAGRPREEFIAEALFEADRLITLSRPLEAALVKFLWSFSRGYSAEIIRSACIWSIVAKAR